MKKNIEIELVRFFSAVAVVLYHAHIIPNGWLAVEIFAVLSGMLMAKSMMKYEDSPTCTAFIVSKIKTFYPELICASLLGLLVLNFPKYTLTELIGISLNTLVNNAFLIRMTGITDASAGVCATSWYLSSMIISMIVTYHVVKILKDKLLIFVLACMVFALLLFYNNGTVHQNRYYEWVLFTYSGNLRIFSEILIGYACYGALGKMDNNTKLSKKRDLFNVIKLLLLLFIIFNMVSDFRLCDGVFVFCVMAFLVLAFASKSLCMKRGTSVCLWLGRMSLPIYLAHYPAIRFLFWLQNRIVMNNLFYYFMLICLVSLFSLVVYYAAVLLRKIKLYS